MKIMLFTIPGLHLGFLGCYGNDWIDTRSTDRLAAEGIVFDQHIADCLNLSTSHCTGLYRYDWLPQAQSPPAGDLSALLQEKGIEFIQLSSATNPHDAGYAQAAQDLLERLETTLIRLAGKGDFLLQVELPELLPPWSVPEEYLQYYLQDEDESSVSGDSALEEQEESDEQGDFEEANEDDHESENELGTEENGEQLLPLLDPPPEIAADDVLTQARLQFTYAALVHVADIFVGEVIAYLKEEKLLDDFALIVTSNRGLALAEHGIVGDVHPWLHDETVHLPLVIRLPRAKQAGRRIAALSQPVDLFATLLDFFAIAAPPCHGKSLLPLLRGKADIVRDHAIAGWQLGDDKEWLLRTPDWALLLPDSERSGQRQTQLYMKPEDRWEVNDVRQQNLEDAEKLEETLRAFIQSLSEAGTIPD